MNKKFPAIETIVFLTGAVVMILEIVGSRLLAPFVGTSLFVWTALIGSVLGSLSAGYWYGGRVGANLKDLFLVSILLTTSAILVALDAIGGKALLTLLVALNWDLRTTATLAALILLGPVNFLTGMVSPICAKLKIKNVSGSAGVVGNLYAISTVGSITGTFVTGFFLLSYLGTNQLLLVIAWLLAVLALVAHARSYRVIKIVVVICITLGLIQGFADTGSALFTGYIDDDTAYNRVWIYDNAGVRTMQVNDETSSAMSLTSPDLFYEYTKFYDLAKYLNPEMKESLMLGGAAYSYPRHYLEKYPENTMDVVEIDPELTELAYRYFKLEKNPRLTIFHEDARTFINSSSKKYDAVFGDVFKSYTTPFQLTTSEVAKKVFSMLNPDGVLVINLIGSINGNAGKFIRAETATYRSVFPQVYLFPVSSQNPDQVQNIMLVALKSTVKSDFVTTDPQIASFLSHRFLPPVAQDLPVLTDDFAPTENYTKYLLLD